jgi:hypothetical protein
LEPKARIHSEIEIDNDDGQGFSFNHIIVDRSASSSIEVYSIWEKSSIYAYKKPFSFIMAAW